MGARCRAEAATFVEFHPEHLWGFRLHPKLGLIGKAMLDPAYADYIMLGPAITQVSRDRVVGCAGLIPQWPGRALAWSLISEAMAPMEFFRSHRFVRRFLDWHQADPEFRRVEATVVESYEEGHRWMRLLGFESEALMSKYCSDEDHRLYARIR